MQIYKVPRYPVWAAHKNFVVLVFNEGFPNTPTIDLGDGEVASSSSQFGTANLMWSLYEMQIE